MNREDLKQIAPSLAELLSRHHARLTVSITSHDVTGGYGSTLSYYVLVEVLTELCNRCGETSWSKPQFDCSYHRFVVNWARVADSEGKSYEQALVSAEPRVAAWLEKVATAVRCIGRGL